MLPYQMYMLDYMSEHRSDEMEFLQLQPYEEDNDPVNKENYVMRDTIQIPKITPELAKRRVQDEIIEFVGNYMDEHAKQLSTSGPVHIITFGTKETKFLYDTFHTSGEELIDTYKKMVQETYFGKISKFITGWIMNAPHKLLITAILVDALQHDYPDIVDAMEYLWAFTEYPILYREFWRTGVKEDVMNYTIEHLGTKFKITKTKNLQEFLKYDATKAVDSRIDKLKTGVDNEYIDLMRSIRNRYHSVFVNIASEYYKNNEKNNTQHTDASVLDDGTLADPKGALANISQLIDNITTKFVNGGINASLVNIAANMTKVDKGNLSGFINQIYSSKDNRIKEFIETLIQSYFLKNPSAQTLESKEFLNFGFTLYKSIGISKDPNYMTLKSILSYWMNDIINIREFYKNEPTVIGYTRSVYNYMVMAINFFA